MTFEPSRSLQSLQSPINSPGSRRVCMLSVPQVETPPPDTVACVAATLYPDEFLSPSLDLTHALGARSPLTHPTPARSPNPSQSQYTTAACVPGTPLDTQLADPMAAEEDAVQPARPADAAGLSRDERVSPERRRSPSVDRSPMRPIDFDIPGVCCTASPCRRPCVTVRIAVCCLGPGRKCARQQLAPQMRCSKRTTLTAADGSTAIRSLKHPALQLCVHRRTRLNCVCGRRGVDARSAA